ncbi:MAG: hypothetical protein WD602_02740 [Actinomycetota bacterium]
MLAFAVVLPGLLVQDGWRHSFFAAGNPRTAAVNDLVWTFLQLLFVAGIMRAGRDSPTSFLLAWGLAANLAAVLGGFQARLLPSLVRPDKWLKAHRDLIPAFTIEFFAARGAHQAVFYVVGGISGAFAVGALRAAEVVLGPLNTLFVTARTVYIPEGVRVAERSTTALLRGMAFLSIVLALTSIAWGVLLLFLPNRIGEFLLGDSWTAAKSVMVPMLLLKASLGASIGPIVGLRAIARANASARVRLILGIVTLASGTVGAFSAGAIGAAVGIALTGALGVALWWRQFTLAVQERQQESFQR